MPQYPCRNTRLAWRLLLGKRALIVSPPRGWTPDARSWRSPRQAPLPARCAGGRRWSCAASGVRGAAESRSATFSSAPARAPSRAVGPAGSRRPSQDDRHVFPTRRRTLGPASACPSLAQGVSARSPLERVHHAARRCVARKRRKWGIPEWGSRIEELGSARLCLGALNRPNPPRLGRILLRRRCVDRRPRLATGSSYAGFTAPAA